MCGDVFALKQDETDCGKGKIFFHLDGVQTYYNISYDKKLIFEKKRVLNIDPRENF